MRLKACHDQNNFSLKVNPAGEGPAGLFATSPGEGSIVSQRLNVSNLDSAKAFLAN